MGPAHRQTGSRSTYFFTLCTSAYKATNDCSGKELINFPNSPSLSEQTSLNGTHFNC